MSKEERFKVYTRSVWQQDYGARAGRPASWRESVAPAIEALLGELRRCADEESLHAAYWEPGDWPGQILLRRLSSDPGPETLLEFEHTAFWLRWQELAEAE